MHEIYQTKNRELIEFAKSWERRRCGHLPPNTIPAAECVSELLGSSNKNRYILASNDDDLRKMAKSIPGVPLVYFQRTVMVLEPPSAATVQFVENSEREKLRVSSNEKRDLGLVKVLNKGRPSGSRKVKAPTPNPLSIKRKKLKPDLVALEAKNRKMERERKMLTKVIEG